MKRLVAIAIAVGAAIIPSLSVAGDVLDEVRFGTSGLLQGSRSEDSGIVGSAELFFAPFGSAGPALTSIVLTPRVELGLSGGMDATDQVFAGLNWHVPLGETFFAEAGFGGTVHNGSLDSGDGPLLGCRLLFREEVALGVRLTDRVNLLATADHSSHANLCDGPNDGITHAGLAVGVKF